MVTYYVGEGDEHRVDHPPIFACREHKSLLTFGARFVAELLSVGQDVMPGNPDEIAAGYMREVQPTFTLPHFLIPPKVVLFNPRGLRGPEALPFTIVLVDKKFFGIPARYLTPDRFDGCEHCKKLKPRRPPGNGPPSGGQSRGGPQRPQSSGRQQGQRSGGQRRRDPGHDSSVRRRPEGGGQRRPSSGSKQRPRPR